MAALRSLLLVQTVSELLSSTRNSPFFSPTASISPSLLKLRQREAWPTHTLLSSFCREEVKISFQVEEGDCKGRSQERCGTLSLSFHSLTVASSPTVAHSSLLGCVATPQTPPPEWPSSSRLEAAFFSPTSMISPSLVPTRIFPCGGSGRR